MSNFSVENPRGFGLLQRGRDFSHYEDLDDRYDKRPSAWIEPKGDWGKGTVDLVEIPTADETNDNIVAFWSPEKCRSLASRWTSLIACTGPWTKRRFTHRTAPGSVRPCRSTGDVKQSNLIRQPDGSVAYLVDFEGPSLAALAPDTDVRSQVSVGENAELVENSVRYNPETKGWRLTLRMKIKDPGKSTEMRAALVQNIVPADLAKTSIPASNFVGCQGRQGCRQASRRKRTRKPRQPRPSRPKPSQSQMPRTRRQQRRQAACCCRRGPSHTGIGTD